MIVYIHGASATAESFTHIRQHVQETFDEPDMVLEYKSEDGFDHNLAVMKDRLASEKRLFFVSHSLGGIYALHLANHYKETTLGGVSLSTPYGGSAQADFAKYFVPFNRLMRDIGTMSSPMIESMLLPAPRNWTQIVSTVGGSPWVQGENDGVVTLRSMRSRTDFELIELRLNHYEIVISDQTVEIILDRIKRTL